MGLFKDKDLKLIERELIGLQAALALRHLARSDQHYLAGIEDAVQQIVGAGRRLIAKGRKPDVDALVTRFAGSASDRTDVELFTASLTRIRAGLTQPAQS